MKKTDLKPKSGVWFYLQYMVYLQWIWWEWEKKKYMYMKNKEKNQSDRRYSGTATRPWYGRQLTRQKW